MVCSLAYHSPSQKFSYKNKDKLASASSIKSNITPVVLYASTFTAKFAVALIVVLVAAFSKARYSKKDLQQIFRSVLDARFFPAPVFAPFLASIVTSPQNKGI